MGKYVGLRYLPTENVEEIVDTKNEETITGIIDIVRRMNRQDTLIKQQQKHIDAIVDLFNEELENAEGELKESLIRISKIEIKV